MTFYFVPCYSICARTTN